MIQPPYDPRGAGAPPPTALVPTRIGDALLVPHGCPLIGRCVKCGAVPANERRVASVHWASPWIYATLLISWIITVIAYYATRKGSLHDVSLCARCAADWDKSQGEEALSWVGAVGALFASVGFFAAGASTAGAGLLLGGPLIGIAGALVARRKRLRAARIDEQGVQLLGVDPSVDTTIAPTHLPTYPLS